jgi:hypothetical protein
VRVLRWEVGAWALSPDGAWLAFADSLPDASGKALLRCVDVASGRVLFEKPGAMVKGLAWASDEALLVVREHHRSDGRLLLHAVPDGGLVGHASLAHVPGRVRVECCVGIPCVLVCSQRMTGGARGEVPRRLVHVFRTEPLEPMFVYDPDETTVLPRLPRVRDCAVGLSPDGCHLAMALDDKLVLRGLRDSRDTLLCDVGQWVGALTWVAPDVLLAYPTDVGNVPLPAQVELISLTQRAVLFSSSGEEPPVGWVGERASIDVSPDGMHLLVAGMVLRPMAPPRAVLRVIELRSGVASALREVATAAERAHGAAWFIDGSIALLRARGKGARVEVLRLTRLDTDPEPSRVELALVGKTPHGARIARSVCGRFLVLSWRVAPERRRRSEYGALMATRLALVETASFVP